MLAWSRWATCSTFMQVSHCCCIALGKQTQGLVPSLQVEKLHDEGVQLKILQTALTLLQSPVHAHLEVRTCGLQQSHRRVASYCDAKCNMHLHLPNRTAYVRC